MEDSGGIWIFVLIAGPAAGWIYYAYIVKKYRNADARYTYERTTDVDVANLLYSDDHIQLKKRMTNSRIHGRNDDKPTSRAPYVQVHGEAIEHAQAPVAGDPEAPPAS